MKTATPESPKNKIITSIVVLVVVTILVLGIKVSSKQDAQQTAANTSQSSPATNRDTSDTTAAGGAYKDGMYNATGSYDSPGGKQSIVVSLTLAANTVSDATVQAKATDGVAQLYQSDFVKGFKSMVVGKDVNGVRLSRVSGSSLTSQGFNKALQQIKNQAKN